MTIASTSFLAAEKRPSTLMSTRSLHRAAADSERVIALALGKLAFAVFIERLALVARAVFAGSVPIEPVQIGPLLEPCAQPMLSDQFLSAKTRMVIITIFGFCSFSRM